MRIVNICLGVLVLVVAAIPFFSGDVTPYAVGRVAGTLFMAAVAAAVFAAVAWFAGGRDENAREAGITIGLVLAMVLTVSPIARERAEKTAPSSADVPELAAVPDPVIFDAAHLFADEVLGTHPYRRADRNSDEGRAYAAASSLLKKAYWAIDEVAIAGDDATKSYWDVLAAAHTQEELEALKTAAADFGEKARRCADFFSKLEQTYAAELRSHGVSARLQKLELADFERHMMGYDRELVNLANLHNLLANHLQSLIDVLIAEWGKWKFEPEFKKVIFSDPQALDSYGTMTDLMKDCLQKIKDSGEDLKPLR